MAKEAEINLKITADGLKVFCQEITRASSNTQRKLATLVALEGFISRHAGADAHTSAYNDIQEIITEFSNETRSQLLIENADNLKDALINRDTKEIARIFSSVSRSGFKDVLTESISRFQVGQLDTTANWIDDWCSTAKQKAEESSGYPDALDFRNTDVDLSEYTAMSEIRTLFKYQHEDGLT